MPTNTTNLSLKKPIVGADEDLWGGYINDNLDDLDNYLSGNTAIPALDVTGDLTVDANTLYVDSTNDRVGINTSSPDEALHISGSTNPTLRIENTSTSLFGGNVIGSIEFEGNDTDAAGVTGIIKSVSEGSTGTSAIVFDTGSGGSTSERMRIDSSGAMIHQAAAVFNESGASADFRVESDNSTHALFVDAANDQVLIQTSLPTTATNVALLKIGSINIATKSVALTSATTDLMAFGRVSYQINVGGQILLTITDGSYPTRCQTYTINFGANWYSGASIQGAYTVVANDGGGHGSWALPTISMVDNGAGNYVLRVSNFVHSATAYVTFIGVAAGGGIS